MLDLPVFESSHVYAASDFILRVVSLKHGSLLGPHSIEMLVKFCSSGGSSHLPLEFEEYCSFVLLGPSFLK